MGQDQSSVFDLAAVAAASNGGNNDPLLPPARLIGDPQKPSRMPYNKYAAYDKQIPFDYPERTWPGKRLQRAPRWCSVDLRDGNQALVNPMDSERKLRFWNLLVSLGFKEIEVGFPSASETDYDFIRMLIERELIPDDVTIVVLTQAREHLIRKTYECLKGAKRAVVHFYNSVSVLQREVVFRKDKAGIKKLATDAATLCKELEGEAQGIDLYYEYSPESFTGTEPEYAVEVCNAVIGVIKPTPEHPMIINLPATVEMTTPNVFADEVEYVSTHLDDRDSVVLSLHPHNDEGMGVAATELAVLAGADRVEGCLLGNGERTGNVDLVTLGLNFLTQGIDPQIDYSNVPEIRKTVEYCNQIKISERHPYAGNFVFTAFSGSHQDAINKGHEYMRESKTPYWEIPYLPIDPVDVGRTYDSDVIRINSQSGKGGVNYILMHSHGINLPKAMREEVGYMVKDVSDKAHKELTPDWVYQIFSDHYINTKSIFHIDECHFKQVDGITAEVTINHAGESKVITSNGNGRLDAVSNAIKQYFNISYELSFYEEHSLTKGSSSKAVAYVGIICNGKTFWGVGIDPDIIRASIEALIVAVNKIEELGSADACTDARMIEIMNYVQANYIDITLDDLAEKFFLSKPYLSKYIKEKSGMTFGDLVKKIRMKKAKALLKSSNMTVENIAMSVGLPEARIPLADAVIMVCNAPKSNSGEMAIDKAMSDIKAGNVGSIPRQLQNTRYDGEDNQNKGQHYLYPHDYKNHYVNQQYLPDILKDRQYYTYGDNKNEQAFKSYWDKIKS